MKKYRHQHESIFDHFQLFLGDLLGRNGLALCGIRMHSKLDHYDLWSRPGGPPMFTFRFHYFASSQLLVRASYLDRTLVALAVLVIFIVLVVIVVLVVPQTCFSVRGSGGVDRRGGVSPESVADRYGARVRARYYLFIINVCHSRTKLPLWIRRRALRCSGACVVLIFIINVRHSLTEMCPTPAPNCYFGSAAEHYGAPVRGWCKFSASLAVPGGPWLPLAVPGCPWLLLGCSWLLLAAAGLLLAAPGCSWLLLAAPGCPWLLLAAHGCLWLLLDASGCY
jgi:hypothetical protein